MAEQCPRQLKIVLCDGLATIAIDWNPSSTVKSLHGPILAEMARLSWRADQSSLVMRMQLTCIEKGCRQTLLAELAPSTPLGWQHMMAMLQGQKRKAHRLELEGHRLDTGDQHEGVRARRTRSGAAAQPDAEESKAAPAGSQEQSDGDNPAPAIPEQIVVFCKETEGLFFLQQDLFVCLCNACEDKPEADRTFSGTGFEAHCGAAASKKWKKSVKVLPGQVEEVPEAVELVKAHPAGGKPIDLGSWLKLIGKGEAKAKRGSKGQRQPGKRGSRGKFMPCRQAEASEDLLERRQLRPQDDECYLPSQPIPQSEDMDCETEEASMLPSDAGEEDVIQESQDAYERTDTCFSLGKQACKGLQHCLT